MGSRRGLNGALQCGRLAWPEVMALGIDTRELPEQRAQRQRGSDKFHAAHEHQGDSRRGGGGVGREL